MIDDLHEYVISSMESLDCPRSLTLAILARYGAWEAMLSIDLDPGHYSDSDSYLRAAQAHAFVEKLPNIPMFDLAARKAAAIKKWQAGESDCARSNARLKPYLMNGPFEGPNQVRLSIFFGDVRKKVSEVLGRPPSILEGKFGPGSTVSDGYGSTIPDKIDSQPTYTHGAWPWLINWFSCRLGKSRVIQNRPPRAVRGNQFFTVPKNSKTDRACAKEPSVNVYYQLALGRTLRSRLKRAGIDLDHGQETHRRLACEGSLSGRWATIDLSNASDTLCKNLVKLLLPPEWYELLAELRSPTTLLGDRVNYLEKFSSMGNGFTFELETLIFACLAAVAGGLTLGSDCYVYGDDIIVPTHVADDVLSSLRFCGFTPNRRKTFTSWQFRESCGGDFFNGVAVRPHFVKAIPAAPQEVISLLNGVRRVNSRRRIISPKYWLRWYELLPTSIRACKGPAELGDIVIHSSEWMTRWKHSVGYVRCYQPVTKAKALVYGYSDDTRLTASLLGAAAEGSPLGWVGRGCVEGYKLGWVCFS